MKIIGTGLNGLVGSRIVELLQKDYEFENLSRSTGVDITNSDQVFKVISSSLAPIVLHMAAYTDVKKAESEKDLGKESEAYKINVIGTSNVAAAAQRSGKILIHFSTDLVVGGDNMPQGGFMEDAAPNPLSWYAQTKYDAEKAVQDLTTPWIIMRTAYPYRKEFLKPDFVRFFRNTLSEGKEITALTDRIISPTFIDDLAQAIDLLIKNNSTGIFNTVGSQILSIYDAAILIANTFNLNRSLIGKITREEFLKGRPAEPFSSALNNGKIKKLGVSMHSFEEGLQIIKNS